MYIIKEDSQTQMAEKVCIENGSQVVYLFTVLKPEKLRI